MTLPRSLAKPRVMSAKGAELRARALDPLPALPRGAAREPCVVPGDLLGDKHPGAVSSKTWREVGREERRGFP